MYRSDLLGALMLAPTLADGPGQSAFNPPPWKAHPHPNDGAWIGLGMYRNAAGQLCCGERDCVVVEDGDVSVTGSGLVIATEELARAQARVRELQQAKAAQDAARAPNLAGLTIPALFERRARQRDLELLTGSFQQRARPRSLCPLLVRWLSVSRCKSRRSEGSTSTCCA